MAQPSPSERRTAWIPVIVVSIWSGWTLRATLTPASYLDDASMHQQMVRVATRVLSQGRDPLTSWFPFLGEGSPQFLHYQSLGAMLTGLAGVFVGPDVAFRWSLLILIAAWPTIVFVAGRILGLSLWAAAIAATVSPFVVSVPGVGFEPHSYVWIGYGLWAQLWASWTLPLAWACTWRAMADRRFLFGAVVFTAATIAFHYETGYLAVGAVVVFPWLVPSHLVVRLKRAAALAAAAAAASLWVVLPLIAQGKWAAFNEALSGTPLENGYGAKQVIKWLVSGQVLDAGHLPFVSILAAVGFVVAVRRWMGDTAVRPVLAMLVACLVLSFGRTTFGSLISIVPGSRDLFFRRFMMGSQLAGLYLAGIGGLAAVTWISDRWKSVANRRYNSESDKRLGHLILTTGTIVLLGIVAYPAVSSTSRYASQNSLEIRLQHSQEVAEGPAIEPLISYINSAGGGRTYAGLPSNWGVDFTVGAVPVFKYLESRDVDEVGYTLRTASLMTDPEYLFDESNPGDFALFGIRYLILPTGKPPPVSASEIMRRGRYVLWRTSAGYFDVVEAVGVVTADRTDIASKTVNVLHLGLVQQHEDLAVSFAGGSAPVLSKPYANGASRQPPGSVYDQQVQLTNGAASATVVIARRSVVLLSASFDPGWTARVDGRPEPTVVLAPALVGVAVNKGTHRVSFVYNGYRGYPILFIVMIAALGVALWLSLRRPRLRT